MQPASLTRQSWQGIGLFILVVLGNSGTISLIRSLTDAVNYSPFQLVFLTNGIAVLLMLVLHVLRGRKLLMPPSPIGWLKHNSAHRLFVLRAICEAIAFSASFYAITQLPLPMHTALLFMGPIFATAIAIWFLGEQANFISMGTIAAGCAGVLMITQPWQQEAETALSLTGALAALLAACLFAITGIIIKLLTRTQPSVAIARQMLWMTAVLALPLALWEWQPIAKAHLWHFLALGGIAFVIQHFVGMAMARAPLLTLIPLNYLQLVFIALVAWSIFDEVIAASTLAGAAVIVLATFIHSRYGARHAAEIAAPEDTIEAE
jgi:drug/metabolite transporter (DMT)-like permease